MVLLEELYTLFFAHLYSTLDFFLLHQFFVILFADRALRTKSSESLNIMLKLASLYILSKPYEACTTVRLRELSQWSDSECGHSVVQSRMA